MIRRTHSVPVVVHAVNDMMDEIGPRFVPEVWLADDRNIALVNDAGDLGLFEAHGSPGVYHGHYFFLNRGKEAVRSAKSLLTEAFDNYGVERIIGYTPLRKLGAMWLTRHLGFTPIVVTRIGEDDFQVWTMHKKEFVCLAS